MSFCANAKNLNKVIKKPYGFRNNRYLVVIRTECGSRIASRVKHDEIGIFLFALFLRHKCPIEVRLQKYKRGEMKFESLDELKAQLEKDKM